jgi:hypothetical protein
MTTMKPCPKCHSTEHLHIEVNDDRSSAGKSVKAWCTECNIFAQIDYVPTGPFANERRPDDVQSVREVIERWNERCDDWEGVFDRE